MRKNCWNGQDRNEQKRRAFNRQRCVKIGLAGFLVAKNGRTGYSITKKSNPFRKER